MKLFVVILNKTEKLDDLITEYMNVGITGSTILSSTGMARVLANCTEEIPFLKSIHSLINPERQKNKTILTVLRDEQLETAVQVAENIIGDIHKKDTGIIFSIPLDFVKGLQKLEQ